MSKKKGRRIKIKKKIIPDFITKIIFRFFLLGLVFSLLALGGRKLAYLFLTNLSYFNLSEVYIKNHYYLEGEEAFAFTRLKPGINIFSLNLSSLAKEIKERHPEYAEIIIKRVLPHRLWVVLKERLPIMQIKMGKFYPVDREGFILPYARETPHTNLPIILGIEPGEIAINSLSHSPRIRKAIEIIALIKEGKYFWEKGVTKINLTSLNDISFFLDNGIEVKFGSPVLKEKFERLSLVLEEVKIKSLSPSFIDLRFKDVILGPQ